MSEAAHSDPSRTGAASATRSGDTRPTGPKAVSASARKDLELQAANLKLGGASGDEIAAAIGVTSGRAGLKAAEAGLARVLDMSTLELRAGDALRIEAAVAAIWPKVEAGDVQAVAALASLLSVRAGLLGLNSPAKPDEGSLKRAPKIKKGASSDDAS